MAVQDPVYDDEDQRLSGQHDDLGVHPEHREAEAQQLEDQFNQPSYQRSPAIDALSREEGHPVTNEHEDNEKSKTPGALGAAETAAGIGGGVGGGVGAADQVGKGFNTAAGAAGAGGGAAAVGKFFAAQLRGKKKRNGIIGGIIGIALAGFGFFSIAQGPFEFIHLAELLGHDFTKSQSDSQSRTGSLLRYVKAHKEGDLRYTRVGPIAAHLMDKVVAQFEEAGVKFTGNDTQGRPTKIEVDRSVIEKNFPETKDMSPEEFDSWLNNKFDVSSTGRGFSNGELDIGGLKSSAIKGFLKNTGTEILGDSTATTAVKIRYLKRFFGLGSLFHPFSKAIEDKIAAQEDAIKKQKPDEPEGEVENEASTDVVDENFDTEVSPIEAPGVDAFDETKATADGTASKIVSNANKILGYVWVTGCTLKGAGEHIVTINRDLTVLPSALEATQLIAKGSQVMYGGSDVTTDQLSAVARGFTDKNGKDIWSGAALQAMEGSDTADALPTNSDGSIANDLPDDYKQAFGSQTFANNIKEAGDFLLSFVPTSYLRYIPIVGGILSPCGLVTAIVVGAGGIIYQGLQILAAPETGGGSVAAGLALKFTITKAAEEGVKAFLGSKLLGFVTNKIINAKTAPKLAEDAFSGPVGGDLIAYGARAAANTAAIASGGLALGNNTSTIIGSAGQADQQAFASESTFAKIFDINDYRSLVGRLSMDISPGINTDIQSGVNSLLNITGTLTTAFGRLIPNVSAAGNNSWTGDYDWGFPQYGIPDSMLNDPDLADPYQNAENVGQYLSNVCKEVESDGTVLIGPQYGSCTGNNGYTARIMTCFGNNLTYNSSVWDVTPTATALNGDVDPNSDSYQNQNANCGDISDQNWKRIVMFINDANNIKALDCLAGDSDTSNQSCQDEGMNSGANSGTSGNSSLPTGTAQQLAQQILNNPNVGYEFDAQQDIQDAANGQPGTAGHPISTTLLQLIDEIAQHHTFKISALESHGQGHSSSPTDPHYLGFAVDIVNVDGDPTANSGIGRTAGDIAIINEIAPLMPKTDGAGISGFGQSECGTTPQLPAGIQTFTDTCSHLHIQIPKDSP